MYYTKHGNATYKCGGNNLVSLADVQKNGLEVGSIATTLPSNEEILSLARQVLNL